MHRTEICAEFLRRVTGYCRVFSVGNRLLPSFLQPGLQVQRKYMHLYITLRFRATCHLNYSNSGGAAMTSCAKRGAVASSSSGRGKKLLDRALDALRNAGFDSDNAAGYVSWIRQYILFHGRRHPQATEDRGTPSIARTTTVAFGQRKQDGTIVPSTMT